MSSIKHIWFDLAGTLYRETADFKVVHGQHRYKTYANLVGNSDLEKAKGEFEGLYKQHGSNSAVFSSLGQPADYWMKAIEELDFTALLQPDPEVITTLSVLHEIVPISLFTNFPEQKTRQLLEHLEIPAEWFTFILTGDDIAERKPALDGFHRIVEKSALPAGQILYIGDRVDVDMKPAKAVGMLTGLIYGESENVDYVFAEFKEIPAKVQDFFLKSNDTPITIEQQLKNIFGLENPICKNLHTQANDVIEVKTADGHFALKLYNIASRQADDVQWELDLTLHLIDNGAPVAKPVAGKSGYLHNFVVGGQEHAAVLFEWAAGEKPKAERSTYVLLGQSAALIHSAADTFTSSLPREKYDTTTLIDEQLERMKVPLAESGQSQRVFDLTERLRQIIANPALDYGVCHMDLTLDNIHRNGNTLTVFDLDSAGESWRAIEAWGVRKFSTDYFEAWLEGYRSVRSFSQDDEKAVAAFGIIGDIRNVVWKLGLARSSRGKPLLQTSDLPKVVDEWLEWEREKINH